MHFCRSKLYILYHNLDQDVDNVEIKSTLRLSMYYATIQVWQSCDLLLSKLKISKYG